MIFDKTYFLCLQSTSASAHPLHDAAAKAKMGLGKLEASASDLALLLDHDPRNKSVGWSIPHCNHHCFSRASFSGHNEGWDAISQVGLREQKRILCMHVSTSIPSTGG